MKELYKNVLEQDIRELALTRAIILRMEPELEDEVTQFMNELGEQCAKELFSMSEGEFALLVLTRAIQMTE